MARKLKTNLTAESHIIQLFTFDLNQKRVVIGTDEAGRGCGAGGVFASAVCFKERSQKLVEELAEMNDSKKLSRKKREALYDIIKENLSKKDIDIEKIENVKVVPYIYDMQKAMSVADLIVCRSGAMTITEVSISGRPAIFVPLSFAAENHQEYNAKVLVKENAAKIIHDNEINGEALNNLINETIKDKEKLKEMGNNARKIVMKDVENKIYNEVKRLLNKG